MFGAGLMGRVASFSIGVVEVPLVMEAMWNFAEIQTGHQECGMTWEVTTREALCAIILRNPKIFACFFLLIKLAQINWFNWLFNQYKYMLVINYIQTF